MATARPLHCWSALGGAVLTLLFRVVTIHDVVEVTRIVWDATLAFVAIIIISTILDKIRVVTCRWPLSRRNKKERGRE